MLGLLLVFMDDFLTYDTATVALGDHLLRGVLVTKHCTFDVNGQDAVNFFDLC